MYNSAGQRRGGAEAQTGETPQNKTQLGTTVINITHIDDDAFSHHFSVLISQSLIECRRLSHHRARAVSQVFRFSGFGTSTSKPSVRAQQRTHARRIDYERVSRSRTDVPSDFGSRRMDDDDDDDDGSTVHVSLSLLSFSVSIHHHNFQTANQLPTNFRTVVGRLTWLRRIAREENCCCTHTCCATPAFVVCCSRSGGRTMHRAMLVMM